LKKANLVAVALLLAVLIGGSFFLFKGSNQGHPTAPTATVRTTTVASTTTTTQPPQVAITGSGYINTSVTEPGRLMCPPGYGCSERTYTLQIYYPSAASSSVPVSGAPFLKPYSQSGYPLVVFGIGFDTMPSQYYPLISAWVNAGYIVAAPIFPLTSSAGLQHYGVNLNDTALADEYEDDLANEPGDMGAAISYVGQLDNSAGSFLYHHVDMSEVAAAGQSDGADATLALVYNNCCVDNSVKAALILSGAEYPGFANSYFTTPAVPMLVTQGSADTINLPQDSQTIYSAAPTPKYYLNLLGATHLEPYTAYNAYEEAVAGVSVDFLNAYTKGDTQALSAMTSAGDQGGVAQLISAG
jgi:predicted dienelactone hydrolase